MSDSEHYEHGDMPFYRREVAPILGPCLLDFHAHFWMREHWVADVSQSDIAGHRYMNTLHHYPAEALLGDARRMFPDKEYRAVCFGQPTPAVHLGLSNQYVLDASRRSDCLAPLLICGKGQIPTGEIEEWISSGQFFGYKVLLNWQGDEYGAITVEDMIGKAEMQIANKYSLAVVLHVPRAGRLVDPVVGSGVRRLAREFPRARIILAHCGRCYLPDEMHRAIFHIADLDNVYLDTAMVMDPQVLQIAFREIGPGRILFGTDLPVAAMRGRRVYAMDHWVDIVLEGYAPSAYRAASSGIRATFMAYEIVLAIRRAGQMAGLKNEEIRRVFYENGMEILKRAGCGFDPAFRNGASVRMAENKNVE